MAMAQASVSSRRGKMPTMKDFEGSAADKRADAKSGAKEGSARDMKQDRAGLAKMKAKAKGGGATCPKCGYAMGGGD